MKKAIISFLFFSMLWGSLLAQSGMGTNYIPKYNGTKFVNSLILDNGSKLFINAAADDGYSNLLLNGSANFGLTANYNGSAHIFGSLFATTINGTYSTQTNQYANQVIGSSLGLNGTGTAILQAYPGINALNVSLYKSNTGSINGFVSAYRSNFLVSNTGSITDLASFYGGFPLQQWGYPAFTGTINNVYGLYLSDVSGQSDVRSHIGSIWGIYQAGTSDMNYFNGNMLLGTTVNAGYRLDVNGQVRIQNALTLKNISAGANIDSLLTIDVNGKVNAISPSRIATNGVTSNNLGTANYLAKFTGGNTIANSTIYDDGTNVGIGTTNTGPYKLAVEGMIGARKIKVTLASPWADYVFEPSYDLKPLSQVEAFVKEHKHLPEVPSAKEVEKNGIDVGETTALLLKKIEELTLYMIEMKKENMIIKADNVALKKRIKAVEQTIYP